jgi:hypothetical protein
VANNSKKRDQKAPEPEPISRAQRSLMYMAGSVLGFGIIAIVALLIGEAALKPKAFEASQIWPVVAFVPEIAIPLGFLLFIVLIVVTYVRRSRAAKGAGQ